MAAVSCALVVSTDWPSGFLDEFWRDHALFGGVVSGVVLLVIGLVIVDRWMKVQEDKKWQRVAETAFQDLADTQLQTYRLLTLASDGRTFGYDVDTVEKTEVEGIVDFILEGRWPGRCDRSVEVLSTSVDWCQAVYPFLRSVEAEQRMTIGRWAPVMIQSDRLSLMLARVSATNHCLRDLREPMRNASRSGHALGGESSRDFGSQWLTCVKLILENREDLHNERRKSQGKPPKSTGVALERLRE